MIILPGAVSRLEPAGAPELYKTYAVVSPMSTHTRKARCAEVGCEAYAKGWRTTLDLSTDLGKRQARYIRNGSGRRFTDSSTPGSPLLVLDFAAGQQCFAEHRVSLHRPPLYQIRGGDHRGNPRGAPTVTRSEADWVDDFGTHQQRLREARERG